jgi:hypothetical protein
LQKKSKSLKQSFWKKKKCMKQKSKKSKNN